MESGAIKDSQITASSTYLSYEPSNGRLRRARGWAADSLDQNQWLQIDLGSVKLVQKVATQGDGGYSNYVTSYKLSYSSDGSRWTEYGEDGKIMVSNRQTDRPTELKTESQTDKQAHKHVQKNRQKNRKKQTDR